ncbi:LOW QUALITY PROTEIN: TPD1 protein homolog 1-like [Chenopodium quinoa]|uniref:LOW QUALITY PROTEIN: TPD1 protein homolog 1-like n=1 Tax=Chenopodium quinoa TaxID=63459 RepID=UPI000B77A304|nr:LOW QUALITY PROTEIN: TPD1 protein homolog 1-like [Chenopodium quinoa]
MDMNLTDVGVLRAGGTYKCSKNDILITQVSEDSSPLPSGIPSYNIVILNACASECNISNIHVNCDWFSSAITINPSVFRRLRYNDCLVNDGKPLRAGESLIFQYANGDHYSLSVSSVDCL